MDNDNMSKNDDQIDEAEENALLKSEDEDESAMEISPVIGALKHGKTELGDDSVTSDDSMDSDSVEMVEREYKRILKELQQCQYSYDKYVRLCELAHGTDDLDNIRTAYRMFSKMYPLSAELWRKYLRLEASVALSAKEIDATEQLFRKAMEDYYSVDLAMEFIDFAERSTDAAPIWREILAVYGINCCNGKLFYQRYRRYIAECTNLSSSEKIRTCVQSYLRELKYPLEDMEATYIEFKVYHEKMKAELSKCDITVDWPSVDADYFKSKKQLKSIIALEAGITSAGSKTAAAFLEYISTVESFISGDVLQTIYERMVAECCLKVECWMAYIEYLERRDNNCIPEELQQFAIFRQDEIDINSRALRNCPWSHDLFINRLQLFERLDKSREQIQEVLESSVSVGFETAESAVAVWMEYLTYLRRNTDWNNEEMCEIIRKNFNLAWTILGQQWGALADCNCEILQFWGRLEYGPLRDASRGRDLWTTVMDSSDNATKSALWIEFVQLEMRRDLPSTRHLFHKALNSVNLDNPYVIVSAWERFERCNGTMKSLKSCQKSCQEFLDKFQPVRGPSTVCDAPPIKRKKPQVAKKSPKQHNNNDRAARVDSSNEKASNVTFPKSKMQFNNTEEHAKNLQINEEKDGLTIFISNLDYNVAEDEILSALSELSIVHVNLIRSANGRSRGFAYLELINETEVARALTMDGKKRLNNRPLYISNIVRDKEKRKVFKFLDCPEENKVFVKNLPPDTTQDELMEIFSRVNKPKDVRMVYHKSGRFKNIAFVEFEDSIAASNTVNALNEFELRGQKVFVQMSEPPPKSKGDLPAKQQQANKSSFKIATTHSTQRPRLSFIPYAVQKKINVSETTSGVEKVPQAVLATNEVETPENKNSL